jgi:hypothetical protein
MQCEYPFVHSWGFERQCRRVNTWQDELTGLRLCGQHRGALVTRVFRCKHCKRWHRGHGNEEGYCWQCNHDLFPPERDWGEHSVLEFCRGVRQAWVISRNSVSLHCRGDRGRYCNLRR